MKEITVTQYNTPIDTTSSKKEGRLKEDIRQKKRKLLKLRIKNYGK